MCGLSNNNVHCCILYWGSSAYKLIMRERQRERERERERKTERDRERMKGGRRERERELGHYYPTPNNQTHTLIKKIKTDVSK